MAEEEASQEGELINPLLPRIDSEHRLGSVREVIHNAMTKITPWDLPKDPEDLKKILDDAVDYATSLKKAQHEG